MDPTDPRWPAKLFEQFGVPADAQLIWCVLLSKPDADIGELAQLASVSVTEAESALTALIDAQFARRSTSAPGVTAIDPMLSIESRIVRTEREIAELFEALAQLRAVVPELASDYARGRTGTDEQEGIEIVVPLADIRRQLYLAGEATKHETRSIYHLMTLDGLHDARQADLSLVERGTRCRSIIGPAELEDPEIYRELEEWHARGEQFRALAEVPTRLQIYDRELAVLMVDATDVRRGAWFIRVPILVGLLVLLFDHLWTVADPIFTSSSDQDAPTGRLARTLELMAIGTKDERIARTLGVGVRTIRRDVATLKKMLGVHSRAEVVAAAIRRGWI